MTTPEQQAQEIAVQAWREPETAHKEMDVLVALAVAKLFAPIIAERDALKAEIKDREEADRQRQNNLRALDEALNGEGGAKSPALVDIVSQCCAEARRLGMPILDAIKGAGEPVAWMHKQGYHTEVSERPLLDDEKSRGWTERPLYTRPCVPLTDEQIYAIYSEHALHQEEGYEVSGWRDFARAIEAAHGIKGA